MSFGLGQPAVCTYFSEISPSHWRFTVSVLGSSLWILGELYSTLLLWSDDPSLQDLHWRGLLIVGALPSCVGTILAALFLDESAVWLASRGKKLEASRILDSMRYWNGRPQAAVSIQSVEDADIEPQPLHFKLIFGRDLRFSTFVSCYTCFTFNFIFGGTLYALPQIFSTGMLTGSSPAISLVFGALSEIPGSLLAVLLGHYVDRRPAMTASSALLLTSILLFTVGGHDETISFNIGFVGMKVTICMAFSVAYMYACEIYPTSLRATGSSMSVGCGRIGAVLAPLAYESLMVLTGTWTTFFYMMASSAAVTCILPFFLPFETRGMVLKDSVDEIHFAESMIPGLCEKAHES